VKRREFNKANGTVGTRRLLGASTPRQPFSSLRGG
jgi:hypothetical protein